MVRGQPRPKLHQGVHRPRRRVRHRRAQLAVGRRRLRAARRPRPPRAGRAPAVVQRGPGALRERPPVPGGRLSPLQPDRGGLRARGPNRQARRRVHLVPQGTQPVQRRRARPRVLRGGAAGVAGRRAPRDRAPHLPVQRRARDREPHEVADGVADNGSDAGAVGESVDEPDGGALGKPDAIPLQITDDNAAVVRRRIRRIVQYSVRARGRILPGKQTVLAAKRGRLQHNGALRATEMRQP